MTKHFRSIIFFNLILISACSFITPTPNTLYHRLGNNTGLEAIVDDFINELTADKQISHFFSNIHIAHFKIQFISHLCHISDGSCQYQDKDISSVHKRLDIQNSDFSAFLDDLTKTLTKFNVSESDKIELLARLKLYKNKIISVTETKSIVQLTPLPSQEITLPPLEIKSQKPLIDNIIKPPNRPQKKKIEINSRTKKSSPNKNKTNKPSSITTTNNKKTIKHQQNNKPALGKVKGKITLLGKTKQPQITVVLEPLSNTIKLKKTKKRTHVVIIKKKVYLPQYLTIQRNDRIAFHNLDKIKHNVFSSSQKNSFDLGTFKTGKRPATRLTKNGIVKVYCDIHSDMAMFIRVTDSPFHQVTNKNGQFSFSNIPNGRYRLKIWSIRGEIEKTIEVVNSKVQTLNIMLDTRQFKKQPHLNKQGLDYPPKSDDLDDEEYF